MPELAQRSPALSAVMESSGNCFISHISHLFTNTQSGSLQTVAAERERKQVIRNRCSADRIPESLISRNLDLMQTMKTDLDLGFQSSENTFLFAPHAAGVEVGRQGLLTLRASSQSSFCLNFLGLHSFQVEPASEAIFAKQLQRKCPR